MVDTPEAGVFPAKKEQAYRPEQEGGVFWDSPVAVHAAAALDTPTAGVFPAKMEMPAVPAKTEGDPSVLSDRKQEGDRVSQETGEAVTSRVLYKHIRRLESVRLLQASVSIL